MQTPSTFRMGITHSKRSVDITTTAKAPKVTPTTPSPSRRRWLR